MRVTPAAAAVPLLLVLLTWLGLRGMNPEAQLFDRSVGATRQFSQWWKARCAGDVLTGTRRHVCATMIRLVREAKALDEALARLREAGGRGCRGDLDNRPACGVGRTTGGADRAIQEPQCPVAELPRLILGCSSARLGTSDRNEPLVAAVGRARRCHAAPHAQHVAGVCTRGSRTGWPGLARELAPVRRRRTRSRRCWRHGRLLHEPSLPATDGVLKALFRRAHQPATRRPLRSMLPGATGRQTRETARQFRGVALCGHRCFCSDFSPISVCGSGRGHGRLAAPRGRSST